MIGLGGGKREWRVKTKKMVEESGRKRWINRLKEKEVSNEYAKWKKVPGQESYADGSSGAKVRMLLRGGCLPVRSNERMNWKYEDKKCVCGEIETVEHVMQECDRYQNVRNGLKNDQGNIRVLDMNEMKGYTKTSKEEDERCLACMGNIWRKRETNERLRALE